MRLFWQQLVQASRVITAFRSGFVGKVSPVHFFWGGFDLACTRFSGQDRTAAPRRRSQLRRLGDGRGLLPRAEQLRVLARWAARRGCSTPTPTPSPRGSGTRRWRPRAAFYDEGLGEFLLPYEAVRSAPDPDAALLGFLQSTYVAAADLGAWDRAALEAAPTRPHDLGLSRA